jgi:hypothetical protein
MQTPVGDATPPPSDTTPPNVAITAPAAGTTVPGRCRSRRLRATTSASAEFSSRSTARLRRRGHGSSVRPRLGHAHLRERPPQPRRDRPRRGRQPDDLARRAGDRGQRRTAAAQDDRARRRLRVRRERRHERRRRLGQRQRGCHLRRRLDRRRQARLGALLRRRQRPRHDRRRHLAGADDRDDRGGLGEAGERRLALADGGAQGTVEPPGLRALCVRERRRPQRPRLRRRHRRADERPGAASVGQLEPSRSHLRTAMLSVSTATAPRSPRPRWPARSPPAPGPCASAETPSGSEWFHGVIDDVPYTAAPSPMRRSKPTWEWPLP